jgi:hypothetical protein
LFRDRRDIEQVQLWKFMKHHRQEITEVQKLALNTTSS